jgi:hypothetical protein
MSAPAASLDGLRAAPCDPLFLAVPRGVHRLPGLTGAVDWALAGAISRLLLADAVPPDAPLLLPAPATLPIGRLVLCRPGAFTARDLARVAAGLEGATPGLCPEDFHLAPTELKATFGEDVILYEPVDG